MGFNSYHRYAINQLPPLLEQYYTLSGHKCQVQIVRILLLDLTKDKFRTAT